MENVSITGADLKVYKHELVTVKVPANSTKTQFYLPDLPNLRDVHLIGIEMLAQTSMLKTPDGTPNNPAGAVNEAFLNLEAYNGKIFFKDFPLAALFYTQNFGVNNPFNNFKKVFAGQKVNWPKCYVNYFGGAVGADFAFSFMVYYRDTKKIEEQDKQASFRNRS